MSAKPSNIRYDALRNDERLGSGDEISNDQTFTTNDSGPNPSQNLESQIQTNDDHVHSDMGSKISTTQRHFGRRLEGLFCLFALAAVLAIVGTMYPYQGRPSPQWPATVSLNTLLAIYSVVISATLTAVLSSCTSQLQWLWFTSDRPLIDVVRHHNAGGGPWGALHWLWIHKVRQPLTALAAIMTLIAIAMQPFTQQILSYADCSVVEEESAATLPRTNYFVGKGYVIGTNASIGKPANGVTIETNIQASILAGFFGLPYQSVAECSTGNCTFPGRFSTVGFCSKCEDVSDSIIFVNETCWDYDGKTEPCSSNLLNAEFTSQLPEEDDMGAGGFNNLTMTWTSGGPHGSAVATSTGIATGPNLYKIFNHRKAQILFGKTGYSVKGVVPTTAEPITGCDGDSSTGRHDPWHCRGYGAAHCSIMPCAREYEASVEAGTLRETLVSNTDPGLRWGVGETDPKENLGGGILALLDTQCTTAGEKKQLTAAGYDLTAAALGRWLPYNVTSGYSRSPSTAPYARCVYAIDYLFASYIWIHFLDVILHSTLNASTVDGPNDIRLLSFVEGGAPLQAMWNMGEISYGRLEEMFRNVSDSLTAAVLVAGEQGVSEHARGNVMHYATCVEVRWGWIAFPAALVVASWALLGMTVRATAGQPLWKASPLALALHWPDGAALARSSRDGKHGKLDTEESMEEMAKLITIRLDTSPDEACLITVKMAGDTRID